MKRRSIFDIDVSNKIDREFAKWQKQSKVRYNDVYDRFRDSLRNRVDRE